MKKVSDIIMDSPTICEKTDSLQTVAKKMLRDNTGSVLVVGQNKHVLGMITDRDIVHTLGKNENRLASELTVNEAMINKVHMVTPDDDLNTALRIMRTKKVARLPVVDNQQRLQGLVSLHSVVKKINCVNDDEQENIPNTDDSQNRFVVA